MRGGVFLYPRDIEGPAHAGPPAPALRGQSDRHAGRAGRRRAPAPAASACWTCSPTGAAPAHRLSSSARATRSSASSATTASTTRAPTSHSTRRCSTRARLFRATTDPDVGDTPCPTKHPIIAITGSSGAGTTSVTRTLRRTSSAARTSRPRSSRATASIATTAQGMTRGDGRGGAGRQSALQPLRPRSEPVRGARGHCSASYAETRQRPALRKYLHDDEEAAPYKQEPGTFTPWEETAARHRPAVLRRACTARVVDRQGRRRPARRPADRRRAGHQPGVDPEAASRQGARAATPPRR